MLPTEKKTEGAGGEGAGPGETAVAEPAEADGAPDGSGADTAELFPPRPLAPASIFPARGGAGGGRKEDRRRRRSRLGDLGTGGEHPQRSRPRRRRRFGLPRGGHSLGPCERARDRKRSLGGGGGRDRGDPALERERGNPGARARRRTLCLVAFAASRRPMAGQ